MSGRPALPRSNSKVHFDEDEPERDLADAHRGVEGWRQDIVDRADTTPNVYNLHNPFETAFQTPRIGHGPAPSSEEARGRPVEEAHGDGQPRLPTLANPNPFGGHPPSHRSSADRPRAPPAIFDQRKWAAANGEVSPGGTRFPSGSAGTNAPREPSRAFRHGHKSHRKHQSEGYGFAAPPPPPVEEPVRRRHVRRSSDSTLCDSEYEDMKKDRKSSSDEALPYSNNHAPDPAGWPIGPNGAPLKPALRRTPTEDYIQHEAAQRAVDLVNNMRHSQNDGGGGPRQRKNGVLSNLLQLYGPNDSAMNRNQSRSSLGVESVPQSRASSIDPNLAPHNQSGWWQPPAAGQVMQRMESDASFATTVNPWELDENDPRLKAARDNDDKEPPAYKRNRWSISEDSVAESVYPAKKPKKGWGRRRSTVTEDAVVAAMQGKEPPEKKSEAAKEKIKITGEVADILQRQSLLLKLAKALMFFGAPSHRLESQLNATARALKVDAQFIHLPGIVIASFGDLDTHTSETQFIKTKGDLNLGSLHRVHEIYRQICHDEVTVPEASLELTRLMKAKPLYSEWFRILIAATCAGIIAPLSFGGSFIDGCVSAVLGAGLAFLQLHVAARSAMYSNIVEISCATIVSFAARGLSQTNYFCYQSLTSAGVVGVLPGYVILCGSLELASRNLMSGSVKLVYSIIYSLFLGFGITIGSDFYLLLDHRARQRLADGIARKAVVVTGAFVANNATSGQMANWSGSFTFTNSTVDINTADLTQGTLHCTVPAHFPWWRQPVSAWWQFLLVPTFSILLSLSNHSRVRSREFPVMVVIGCIGWATNSAANRYIFNRSDVVSFIGAFVIGILGNMYSRILRGTAFTAMTTGVLFLVPAGISAAGGLGTTSVNAQGDAYSNGLVIGFRMVQVAIGITVGLFFSSFMVYSIGTSKKGTAIFAF